MDVAISKTIVKDISDLLRQFYFRWDSYFISLTLLMDKS